VCSLLDFGVVDVVDMLRFDVKFGACFILLLSRYVLTLCFSSAFIIMLFLKKFFKT